MSNLKTLTVSFLKSIHVKRAGWTVLNAVMGLVVAYIAYLATDGSIQWAVTILPFVTALSQFITKTLNTKKPVEKPIDKTEQKEV